MLNLDLFTLIESCQNKYIYITTITTLDVVITNNLFGITE